MHLNRLLARTEIQIWTHACVTRVLRVCGADHRSTACQAGHTSPTAAAAPRTPRAGCACGAASARSARRARGRGRAARPPARTRRRSEALREGTHARAHASELTGRSGYATGCWLARSRARRERLASRERAWAPHTRSRPPRALERMWGAHLCVVCGVCGPAYQQAYRGAAQRCAGSADANL